MDIERWFHIFETHRDENGALAKLIDSVRVPVAAAANDDLALYWVNMTFAILPTSASEAQKEEWWRDFVKTMLKSALYMRNNRADRIYKISFGLHIYPGAYRLPFAASLRSYPANLSEY